MLVQELLIQSQLLFVCLVKDVLDGSGIISLVAFSSKIPQLTHSRATCSIA